ncbi:leucine-rich_repeat domain-containing protein [Hexamita inflata]|uniref:Leucine-rich_repeat domain-containing protein n=2 Tax=Hexamita inflata TaxID=28002 RepID=A0ABP1GKP2_9EUKA
MNLQEKHDQRVLDLYKNMVKSNTLTIEQSDLVQNIQFVDQLPINTLKVYYSYDIRFDRVPSKITSLQFTNCPKTNFQGFEQMKQLKILTLNYNSLIKINFLSVLVNLTYLNISYNDIENVSPIENLIELKQIKLDFNKIQDISPLRKLVKLEIIHLNSNQVIDLYPIKYLKELKQLYLQQNQIINILPLKCLTQLVICDVNNNMIQNLSEIPLILQSEEENEEEDLFDEEQKFQFKPTKQQLLFQNKITAVYKQRDKLLQQCQRIKTATLSIKQKQSRTRQLLANLEEAQVYWSSRVAILFQAMNGVTSQ